MYFFKVDKTRYDIVYFTNEVITSVISPLHSGITEEDLRAAGVTNPSHRRRILENLPRNWNWHTEIKKNKTLFVVRSARTGRPRRERRTDWWSDINHISWTLPQPCRLFIYSINTVTIVSLCQHSKGNRKYTLHSLLYSPSISTAVMVGYSNGKPCCVSAVTDTHTNIDYGIKVSLILF